MLLKNLANYIEPEMKVVLYDLDKTTAAGRSESTAGQLKDSTRFDYNSKVICFYITPDYVIINYKRYNKQEEEQ